MRNAIGISVYLSHFERQKEWLETVLCPGRKVFTSLQIPEEQLQPEKILSMLKWLKERGAYIITDINPRVLKELAIQSMQDLVITYPIDNIRLDDGFSTQQVAQFLEMIDVTINASTQGAQLDEWDKITQQAPYQLFAQFNYYPRVETGLDSQDVQSIVEKFASIGIRTMAFVAGDECLRGPLYSGLSTIEMTRNLPPVLAYLKLLRCGIDDVFIGDVKLSNSQWKAIESIIQNETLRLPVVLKSTYDELYDKIYKIRIDSPSTLLRMSEARCTMQGDVLMPRYCTERVKGSITLDNVNYKRYSGEIQLIGKSLPPNERVNVIGRIDDAYLPIFELDIRGLSVQFIKEHD
ncbi:DUF871 family protein [Aerococcaceae bacterium zg-ZUI334]|uniref:MupG family TIM beta-alpha barrel fold protein n=1 Tax=Aerococcaceae bacterium zg-252 TaxID=2796928 RepID=UPI001BA19FCB|nr:DUF871 family protein [Aerococcaceae bacterium zg-ZUI334]